MASITSKVGHDEVVEPPDARAHRTICVPVEELRCELGSNNYSVDGLSMVVAMCKASSDSDETVPQWVNYDYVLVPDTGSPRRRS